MGRSMRTGPGRPDRMTWKACAKTIGTRAGSRTMTPFGHRLGDGFDVDGLEILLGQFCARRLAGNAKDRDGIRRGRVESGDHVRAGGAGRADADADIARLGARIAVGHVRSALDMAGEDMPDR